MTAHPLAPVLANDPSIRALLGSSRQRTHAVAPRSLHVPLLHTLIDSADHPDVVLVVTASSREADQVRSGLGDLEANRAQVWELPPWETLPHERLSPHPETIARRLSVIRALTSRQPGTSVPLVVVASVRALIQPVGRQLADSTWLELRQGASGRGLESWARALTELAYQRVDLVTRRGEYAIRGGILDVFPALVDHPIRADFFGDTIDELTWFQVADQRSLEEPIDTVDIPPAREMLLTDSVRAKATQLMGEYPGVEGMLAKISQGIVVEGMESLQPVLTDGLMPVMDFFPETTHIVELEPQRVRSRALSLIDTNREFLEAAWEVAAGGERERPIDFHTGDFYTPDEVLDQAGPRPWWALHQVDSGLDHLVRLDASAIEMEHSGGPEAIDAVRGHLARGDRVIVAAAGHGLVERAMTVLGEADIPAREWDGDVEAVPPGVVAVAQASVATGFVLPGSSLVVFGEHDFLAVPDRFHRHRRSGRLPNVVTGSIPWSFAPVTTSFTTFTESDGLLT